jgi:hypothetical protein
MSVDISGSEKNSGRMRGADEETGFPLIESNQTLFENRPFAGPEQEHAPVWRVGIFRRSVGTRTSIIPSGDIDPFQQVVGFYGSKRTCGKDGSPVAFRAKLPLIDAREHAVFRAV